MRLALLLVGVIVLGACADPLDDPDGIVAATLDADDMCINTSLSVRVDDGSDYWYAEEDRPADWSGPIHGTFSWRGDRAVFVARDGTELGYFRIGVGEYGPMDCALR